MHINLRLVERVALSNKDYYLVSVLLGFPWGDSICAILISLHKLGVLDRISKSSYVLSTTYCRGFLLIVLMKIQQQINLLNQQFCWQDA